MLQDTFATSQIQFVFEITLIALKYKPYNFKLSPKRSCEKNGHNECEDGNIIGHYERELKYIFLFDLSIIID
jgi:hypothetical protein